MKREERKCCKERRLPKWLKPTEGQPITVYEGSRWCEKVHRASTRLPAESPSSSSPLVKRPPPAPAPCCRHLQEADRACTRKARVRPPTHSRRVGQTRGKRVTKPGSPGGDFWPHFCVSCHLPAPQRPHLTAPLARPASRVLATPEGALRPGPAPCPSGRSWTPPQPRAHCLAHAANPSASPAVPHAIESPWRPARPHLCTAASGPQGPPAPCPPTRLPPLPNRLPSRLSHTGLPSHTSAPGPRHSLFSPRDQQGPLPEPLVFAHVTSLATRLPACSLPTLFSLVLPQSELPRMSILSLRPCTGTEIRQGQGFLCSLNPEGSSASAPRCLSNRSLGFRTRSSAPLPFPHLNTGDPQDKRPSSKTAESSQRKRSPRGDKQVP